MESRPTPVYGINQHLINTKAVFLSTHGAGDGSKILLRRNESDESKNVYFQPDDVTNNVGAEFVFISACYSAKTNEVSKKNLCSTLVSNGAKAVIGYGEMVLVSSSRYYETVFYQKFISSKSSVASAFVYASVQTQAKYGSTDSVVTSVKLFGNGEYKY